jgi:predicted CopG family antitoxin
MVKTIAISNETYDELLKLKEELETRNMDDAVDKLIVNYKRLLKQLSMKRLLEANKKENKVTLEELLKDRKVYGWPRKLF